MEIRPAVPADADALGDVHVRAWQAAYRGAMPAAYLDGLSAAERARMWARGLSRARDRDPVLVADVDGHVVGFAAMGPAAEPTGWGELFALNVDPDWWGRGTGRALLDAAERELAALGHAHAVLWVLPANPRARRLYESAGWRADGARREVEVLGVTVPEMRYARTLTAVSPRR